MMNKIINLILLSCLPFIMNAQVKESPRSMPLGTHSAITTMFDGTDDDQIRDWWKSYMSEYGRMKKMKKSSVYLVENIVIDQISFNNAINVYADVSSSKENTELAVWIDKGDTQFINSSDDPGGYDGAEALILDFRLFVQKEEIKLELESENKSLKKLESNLSKLKRENESLHKTIELAKEKIAKAEVGIEENINEQETATEDISSQMSKIEAIMERLESVGKN